MRRTLTLAIVLALLIAACADGAESTTTSAGDVTTSSTGDTGGPTTTQGDDGEEPSPGRDDLIISLEGEPPTFDVSTTASTFTVSVLMYNVLETLVRLDPTTGDAVPGLAESWERSDDGTVYTFTLRQGATFSTGEPVTAQDVAFSYETMSSDTAPYLEGFAAFDSVEALDDSTVQVTLSAPSNNWLKAMATRSGLIFSEAHYGEIAENPIGSGPFKVEEWTRGESITLTRNEHYDGAPAQLSTVQYVWVTDPGAQVNALLAGDIDVQFNLNARDRADELTGNGFVVLPTPTPRVHAIFFRHDAPIVSELAVRQAISHAVDKQGLVDALSGGFGTPVPAWVGTGNPWYEDYELYPYDVQAAQDLLAEAGYPDGIDIEMTVISENISGRQGELVALMLEEAGIRVELNFIDVAAFLDGVIGQGEHQSSIVASVAGIDRFADGNGWFTGWNNEAFNQLIADADVAETTEEQNALMAQAARLFAEEAVVVAEYNDVNVVIHAPGLENWDQHLVDQGIDLYPISWSD